MKVISLIYVFLLIIPMVTNASGVQSQLQSIELVNDKVVFSLQSSKTHTTPSCAASPTQAQWTFALNDVNGRAMYSMLMTAVAKQQQVEVTSAQICLEQIELVSSIRLVVSQPTPTSSADSQTGQLYLYKGDGVTKLGIYAGQNAAIMYLPIGFPAFLKGYDAKPHALYYLDEQCQGDAYLPENRRYAPYLDPINNRFVKAESERMKNYPDKKVYFYSLDTNDCRYQNFTSANTHGRNYYKANVVAHPLCGLKGCIVK
ncbi:hypothetical protein [Pseudoalteromonas aurantia]|uniref:Secreted protein n=1 Tax=Pseudoalteromonas aurantia 208 TaxID=1314867 RepID=A0ABR9EC40_9GAMM|nr:hypothetical protein [Pseudoalteromonas aurantia]MBE0368565.1 hypothetical protein [Pseudoalteromonas aurantia 208]